MSLDVSLVRIQPTTVFSANITHNLRIMADHAGIYQHVWRPEEISITKAGQLIEPLKTALALMNSESERFTELDAENGWGTYVHFMPWLKQYLEACEEYPDADIEVSR